jgi:hypothetical protein
MIISWMLRSTVVLSALRCVSSIIGSEFFVEETIGYGIMGMLAISNEKIYTCVASRYHKEYQVSRQDMYIPKSKRNKGTMYLWWLELYDAGKLLIWQPIEGVLAELRTGTSRWGNTWKKKISRRKATISNKRIAQTRTSYRGKNVVNSVIHKALRHFVNSTRVGTARCYMSKGKNPVSTNNSLNEPMPPEFSTNEVETWDTDSF